MIHITGEVVIKDAITKKVLLKKNNSLTTASNDILASAMGFHSNQDLRLTKINLTYDGGAIEYLDIEEQSSNEIDTSTFKVVSPPLGFSGEINQIEIKTNQIPEAFAILNIDPTFTKIINQAVEINWSFKFT